MSRMLAEIPSSSRLIQEDRRRLCSQGNRSVERTPTDFFSSTSCFHLSTRPSRVNSFFRPICCLSYKQGSSRPISIPQANSTLLCTYCVNQLMRAKVRGSQVLEPMMVFYRDQYFYGELNVLKLLPGAQPAPRPVGPCLQFFFNIFIDNHVK